MIVTVDISGKKFRIDSSRAIDISIPLRASAENVSAWYVKPPRFEPVRMGDWIGDVNQGGSVNFRDIFFNPHGHGTHTECVGHISKEAFTINQCLKEFMFVCQVVSIAPEEQGADHLITLEQIKKYFPVGAAEALAIRTLPNAKAKLNFQYSNSNPCYIHHEALAWMVQKGVKHLLFDMPSVDKEQDGGKLLGHHAFWEYPHNTRAERTITELIYIPNEIPDGTYLLHLQIASFENDASPSKPVLYRLES